MSQGKQAGSPISFRCSKCRRNYPSYRRWLTEAQRNSGWLGMVVLTGRERPYRRHDHALGQRSTSVAREYECQSCGHVGWSNHFDLARKAGRTREGCHDVSNSD